MARYQTNHETKECTETIIGKIAHKKKKQNKTNLEQLQLVTCD